MKIYFVLLIFFLPVITHAHTVGNEAWCLIFSPFHKECIYKKEDECYKDRNRNAVFASSETNTTIPKNFEKVCSPNDMASPKSFFNPL